VTEDRKVFNDEFRITIFSTFANKAPRFQDPLQIIIMLQEESKSWKLPRIVDDDNDSIVSVKANLLNKRWITFDSDKFEFSIDGTVMIE
jgi:hypothetical protein